MANTDFGILLKTLLDKSGINSELEQVQKIVNKYSIDIMPELKTASLRNQMKAVSQEIANDFNKAFGTNLTGNDVFKAFESQAKQAEKAIKDQAKAAETARKEQEALNERIRQGQELAKKQANESFTSKQAGIYKEIIKNQEQIYALKKKLLSADELETEEINKQIHSLEVKNKYNRDYKLANNGMIDSSWDKIVQESKEALESQYKIADTRKQDNANAKESARIAKETAQAEKERLATLEKQRVATANSAKEKAKSNAQQELAQQKEINAILSKQESAYKEIWNINKQIATLDPTKNSDQISALNEKKKFYQETYLSAQKELQAYNNIAVSQEHLVSLAEIRKKAESEIGVAVAKQNEALAKAQAESLDKIQLSMSNKSYEAEIATITKNFTTLSGDANEAKTHVESLNKAYKSMVDAKDNDTLIQKEREYQLELAKTKNLLIIAQAEAKEYVNSLKVQKLRNDIQDWLNKNTAATKEAKNAMQSYLGMLDDVDHVSQLTYNNVKGGMDDWDTKMRQAGKLGKSLTQTFKEGAKSFIEWTVSSVSVMEVVNGIKKVVDNVVELDDKLLELDKVSDLTADGLKNATKQAYELGEQVGKTGTQVVGAVTEFKRAGYDLEESFEMAEAAMVMTNVAEGITETSDAAGTLISILKGFNMSESSVMSIVDMLNSTSNQSPIGFDELAEGLERTAGTLAQSGTSIQQTIGLITAGYAQLRNVEKVSTSLITLSARLRGVNEDGEVIDGLSAELQKSFGDIGVEIENTDGSLRNIYEIAQDYAKVLPTLTDKQKQYYAELAAGKRNVTTWNAITQQFQDAENATAQAIDSVGSASVENAKYLDSIGGKIEKFKSSAEQLSNTLVNSGLVKFFIDLGTGITSTVDSIINFVGIIPTIGAGVGAFAGIKNFGRPKMFGLCFEIAEYHKCSLGY